MSSEAENNSLGQKLVEIGKRVGYIEKDGTNAFHKYDFTSHSAVVRSIYPLLWEYGIYVSSTTCQPTHVSPDLSNVIVFSGVTLTDAETKESVNYSSLGQGSDKGDKAVMKANTAANKYVWQAALGLAWGDDPEADATVDERAHGKPAAKKKSSRKKAPPKKSKEQTVDAIVASLLAKRNTVDAVRELKQRIENSDKNYAENQPEQFAQAIEMCDNKMKELAA